MERLWHFKRTPGQHGRHDALLHGDFDTGSDFHGGVLFSHLARLAKNVVGGDRFITLDQGFEHCLSFFLTLHLWAGHDEP